MPTNEHGLDPEVTARLLARDFKRMLERNRLFLQYMDGKITFVEFLKKAP